MKKSPAFQPSILNLEDRLALSGVPAITVTPGEVLAVEREQTAIVTFAQGYQSAVQSVLFAPSTTPSGQRAAFDTQVGTLLNTLQTSLISAVEYLPNSASLTTEIEALVTGGGPTSLESELDAIPTPTGSSNLTFAVFEGEAIAALAVADANLASDTLGYTPG